MRSILSVLFLLCGAAAVNGQSLTPEEKKEGFISLFNGKDFDGWRFDAGSALDKIPSNWKVGDGVIHLLGGAKPHIGSQWTFDDFEMRLQWKAYKKGYNSGFYVRSGRNVGANQINLAQNDCGHLMSKAVGGVKVPELQMPIGEWNDWRVLAEGEKLTFWCNGKQAWSVVGFAPKSGYVGLQAEGAAIDFKNLRVRELGYRQMYELAAWKKATGWTESDGVLKAASDAQPLVASALVQNSTVRIEYQSTKGVLTIGGTKINLGEGELAKAANPAGQWNYLQVAMADGKGKIWINGVDVKTAVAATVGNLELYPNSAEMLIRNVRVR